jgi:hypothetical protein
MNHSYLLPGECRHIGVPRAPVAPIEPSVPLAFMCPLLASESPLLMSSVSTPLGEDDFLSDGRSSFAWHVRQSVACFFSRLRASVSVSLQVSVFTAANTPSEFSHAVSLATSRVSDTSINGEPQQMTQPSTVAMPLPSARALPTRPNASDKFHSAPDSMYLRLLQTRVLRSQ